MRSTILCYAAADADFARELAGFIELNCAATRFDKEALIQPGCDLIDAAERALSADCLLILLSPDSWSGTWLRARWEPILVDEARKFETQIAYVLLRPCKFPDVFRRNAFFDLSEDRLAGQRILKRWLLRQNPFFQSAPEFPEPCASTGITPEALDRLECGLADQPGVQAGVSRELALTFAHTHGNDFELAVWLNCANRSRAAILGDTAQALGLRLRGTLEQNASALQEFCASRRLLLIFEHVAPADRELVTYGGRASVVFIAEGANSARRSLEETAAIFSSWRNNFGSCLSALGDVQSHLRDLPAHIGESYQIAISLGSTAFSCLRHAGRLAEACELLEWMADAMRARGDLLAAAQFDWEKSWILEEWGSPVTLRTRTTPLSQPVQLSLGLEFCE
jgi:hypothetical protein